MLQLNPSEKFIIARQLADSADTATYYVRAMVKDSDGNTIETIDLTDNGSQFFSKTWVVPKDATGNGDWITIQTKVYTDAAYTTLSNLYGSSLETYLIQQRINAGLALGGGGADISYKKVRDIIQEELKKLSIPETDLTELAKRMSDIDKSIIGINLDLSPLVEKISSLEKFIDNLPAPEKVNLNPIIQAIKQIENKISELENTQNSTSEEQKKTIQSTLISIDSFFKEIKNDIMNIEELVKNETSQKVKDIKLKLQTHLADSMKDLESIINKTNLVKEEKPKESKFKDLLR